MFWIRTRDLGSDIPARTWGLLVLPAAGLACVIVIGGYWLWQAIDTTGNFFDLWLLIAWGMYLLPLLCVAYLALIFAGASGLQSFLVYLKAFLVFSGLYLLWLCLGLSGCQPPGAGFFNLDGPADAAPFLIFLACLLLFLVMYYVLIYSADKRLSRKHLR